MPSGEMMPVVRYRERRPEMDWWPGSWRGRAGAIRPTHDLAAAGFNMMNNLRLPVHQRSEPPAAPEVSAVSQ